MTTTERADYKFAVKEGSPTKSGADDAPVFLACEPRTKQLSIVGKGTLTLCLRPGTTVLKAQQIARYLQQHITHVAYTA